MVGLGQRCGIWVRLCGHQLLKATEKMQRRNKTIITDISRCEICLHKTGRLFRD
jgi:hypothetical protein